MLKYLQIPTFLVAVFLALPCFQSSTTAQTIDGLCYTLTSTEQETNFETLCNNQNHNFLKSERRSSEEPKLEFARLRIYGDYASGRVTNLSQQNVSIYRINIVDKNQTAQIVVNLYLKPGQATTLRKAIVLGGTINGSIADVTSWLDTEGEEHYENFNVCKYISNVEEEKRCMYK